MSEDTGGALPKGTLYSKIATCRTEIEVAQRSTRSTHQIVSDAGLNLVEIGQYFFTLVQKKGRICDTYAENTQCFETRRLERKDGFARTQESALSWWTKNCHHEDRYSDEVRVESLFQDHPASGVRTVSGSDKYVTKSMQTKKEEHGASVRFVANARPIQKPAVTLSSVSVLVRDRKWIDIETQRSHDHRCHQMSKAMIQLLRHDQSVPRGSDGAIHHSDIIEECRRKKFDDASQWFLEDWISPLAKGGGAQNKFQHCVNPNSHNQFLFLRVIQGHSEESAVDPALQDNMLIPKRFTEYL